MDIRQFRVTLRAKDFDRTTRFYGETLALSQTDSWEHDDLQGALYPLGPCVVEVIGRAAGARRSGRDETFEYQGPSHKMVLNLVVPDAEQAYRDLLFRDQNIPGGLRRDRGDLIFETHDPDGVKIVFRQLAAPA